MVTGAAGFIGYHVCAALLDRGLAVIGLDSLNAYYDPTLKRDRLSRLEGRAGFTFVKADIAAEGALVSASGSSAPDVVIHLAAQAGVRHSIDAPMSYADANLAGHLRVLEYIRCAEPRPFLVYASSSSVYGANAKTPYAETDRVDAPVSLYAATKRAGELMSEAYARLYGIEQVGLRFFTVYGPWGRPDMAYYLFTDRICAGEPISVFNNGDLKRDFTYIDDIVDGVLAVALGEFRPRADVPHRIYNIGNNEPVALMDFIAALEAALGRKAIKEFKPMQPGDVYATFADISAISADYGFRPTTKLADGLLRFVEWRKDYKGAA
ncbi:MAG: NAD-dependent epimerase/dehydratase family protein [Pseudomonadota bacterium]